MIRLNKNMIMGLGFGIITGIVIGLSIGFNFTTDGESSQDSGDFILEYDFASEDPNKKIKTLLEESDFAPNLILNLNEKFILPKNIPIQFTECTWEPIKKDTAYYYEDEDIIICYEDVVFFYDLFFDIGLDSNEKTYDFFYGMLMHVIIHEVGHAIIDQYNIHVTSNEEDAADYLATLFLLEQKQKLSGPVFYFYEEGIKKFNESKLKSTSIHSLEIQRFENVVCLAYGEDPEGNPIVPQIFLDPGKANSCPKEYEKAYQNWSQLLKENGN